MLKLLLVSMMLLLFAGCFAGEEIARPSTLADKPTKKVFNSKIPGLPLPFGYRVGGIYGEEVINAPVKPPVASKTIARKWMIWFLLAVAGAAFLAIPVCIFAAIYWHFDAGIPIAIVSALTSFIASGSAYFFDYIMWVFAFGLVCSLCGAVYLAFHSGKLRKVIDEVVDAGEQMKNGDWDDTMKKKVLKIQSETTKKAVKRSKMKSLKKGHEDQVNSLKTK